LYVGTWNVNAKGKDEPLDDWLCADWNTVGLPDLVAVGFQEIVDLNAVNVAVDNKTQQRSQFWTERLTQTLNDRSNNQYVLVTQKSMVGLLLCVFTKRAHATRVKHVTTTSVGVGVMGMMGNKGGVACRLQFYDSSFSFVCSHLAAHRENVMGRNADFANVSSKASFEIGESAIREVIRSGSLSQFSLGSSAVGLADHDHTIWLGDLNYRIDESMPTEQVLQLASTPDAANAMRNLDQLNLERAAGRVFEGYKEGKINFRPTYKFQPGTDVYDQRPDKKVRAPAWCDRILWMSESSVQQLTYNISERPNCSDHKPVYSSLRVTIKDVVEKKREAIYDELMALLDRYENQSLPMVGLDRVSLDFGEVRYNQSLTLPIQITNTGSVVAQFRLVPKPEEVRQNSACSMGSCLFVCHLTQLLYSRLESPSDGCQSLLPLAC
jgi:phosphatidylinositol-bisphosphatase